MINMENNTCMKDMEKKDIKKIKDKTLNENDSYQLAEFFKVFGDMSRIRILHLLSINEICVHEISNILDISQSATSHQLKILRDTKLVKPRKDGKHVYYSLSDNHVLEVFKNGLKHIKE